ncbi:MAG TPA: hypothetical protein VIM18_02020 [Solirubrobacteraceae bacterium]
MHSPLRDMPDLELALLRRGLDDMAAGSERCRHCHRTPLIGERVYIYEPGGMLCELCREAERDAPAASRIVHGPEFGHTMRITDQRTAA